MYEIFSFLKQAGIVIHFLNLLIVIQLILWNRKERYSTVGHALFKPVRVSASIEIFSLDGVRYSKLPVATAELNTSKFF